MRESAKSLMIPVYLFIVSDALLVGIWFLSNFNGSYALRSHSTFRTTNYRCIIDSYFKGLYFEVLPH